MWKRAEDIVAGDLIDMEPLLRKYDPDNEGGIIVAEAEYVYVEGVRKEDLAPDYPVVIYTNIANLAVSRDERIDIVEDI